MQAIIHYLCTAEFIGYIVYNFDAEKLSVWLNEVVLRRACKDIANLIKTLVLFQLNILKSCGS